MEENNAFCAYSEAFVVVPHVQEWFVVSGLTVWSLVSCFV